ncbi:hypothetical protein P3S67_015809 [Capsicum chacoense]
MGDLNEIAAEALVAYLPQKWFRAYLDTKCKIFMVDNNFTESVNSWIVEARQKAIIKMIEDIRVKVMNMLKNHDVDVRSWKNKFSTHAMKLFNDYKVIAQQCNVEFNRERRYKVTEGRNGNTVHIEHKRCICRAWVLTEIPCLYTIKAFLHTKIFPIDKIYLCYSKGAYLIVYTHKLQPVKGENF